MSKREVSEILDAGDYDSSFEGSQKPKRFKSRQELVLEKPRARASLPQSSEFVEAYSSETGRIQRFQNASLDAYSRHKKLINDYFLYHPGATKLLKPDTSAYKHDIDVIKEHHQFLWDNEDDDDEENDHSWEKRLARRYYDKLFKEYCIADLSRYKENKTGMRWRIEKEVIEGKGQFICGSRGCSADSDLTSWEVNFGYMEHGHKKNALVKLRLCVKCSKKLNYHHKRKEAKKPKKKKKDKKDKKSSRSECDGKEDEAKSSSSKQEQQQDESDKEEEKIWSKPQQAPVDEQQLRNDEMDDFLEDMFL